MSFSPSIPYRVHVAEGIYEQMLASVGKLEPEHYAVLGGYLHDPHRITDFMPMPPMTDEGGRNRSSSATVTLNGPFIEYYLNTCLLPFGKFILGIMHSHPGGMRHLSGGAPGSGYGDIPSMRAHLEAAARMGDPWHDFIAPIVTFPGENPRVDTWIVRLDTPEPIRAETIWEKRNFVRESKPEAVTALPEEFVELLLAQPDLLNEVLRKGDRLKSLTSFRSLRAEDQNQTIELVKRLERHAVNDDALFQLLHPITKEDANGHVAG